MWELTGMLTQFAMVLSVIGVIGGIVCAFVIFFVFMSKKNEHRFTGFLGWLYDYLQFKNFIVEGLLKFLYVLGACVFTCVGVFNIICLQFVPGLLYLVFANVGLRVVYEFALMLIMICRNVSDINKKLGGTNSRGSVFQECKMPPMPKREAPVVDDSVSQESPSDVSKEPPFSV